MFNFTSLLGARASSQALQSLLEFEGGIKILIDVGWDVSFNAEALKELERQVPTISIILLTHATISHVGAYAHCCKHIPLFRQIPVYATSPVISLSRTLLQDLYTSTPLAASFIPSSSLTDSAYSFVAPAASENSNILLPPPSPENITEYFTLANELKYLQPHQPVPSPFSPPLDGLTITAYCAGHTLGGTIWQVQYGSESVVYAVDWHQARENVFPGAAWLSGAAGAEIVEQLRQPTVLICSSKTPKSSAASGGRQQRDDLLLAKIKSAIKDGGDVLIPCDTSARVLEIAFMLDRAWANDKSTRPGESLQAAKLYLANSTSSATLRYARSMIEWMDESVVREFEAGAQSKAGVAQVFDFRHVKLLERKSQVDRAVSSVGPKVFLASDKTLEWGIARQLLGELAAKSNSLVILTDPAEVETGRSKTMSTKLWDLFMANSTEKDSLDETVQLKKAGIESTEVHTSALAGSDLSIYQQYLARQRQRLNTAQMDQISPLDTAADMVEEGDSDSSSSSEESDTKHQGKALNVTAALTHSKHKLGLTDEELGINILVRRKNVHDFDVRGKKGRDKAFPYVAKRRRNDDFGDLIRPEEYLRAEERDDIDGQDMAAAATKSNPALGRKRKWGDAEEQRQDGRKKGTAATQKRRKGNDGAPNESLASGPNGNNVSAEADDDDSESDYEPAEAVTRGPMKATMTTTKLVLNIRLAVVDFSGIHDMRSLQMLIPLIKPRKLILTGGTEVETTSLAETCRKLLASSTEGSSKIGGDDVFAPAIGEMVDASVDTNAWTIKLSQSLFRQLRWQNFRDLGIVTINGCLEIIHASETDSQSEAKRRKLSVTGSIDENEVAEETPQLLPVLGEMPLNLAVPTRATTQALHVGDLRLAELRKIMQFNGHTAEFKGEGTLLVDGIIAVRKSGIGKIEVEAGGLTVPGAIQRQPGASFYDVKRKIYEGLAVVAAR